MKNTKHTRFKAFVFFLTLCCFSFFSEKSSAQIYTDAVYDPDVATVTFHVTGSPVSMPIVDLGARDGVLHLGFDQLLNDISDFSYTVIHCDQDWKASDLRPNEYLKGFNEGRIQENFVGFNTLVNYFHYDLKLPNRDIRWTKSGNYVLQVYDEYEPERIILTRRFMVVEPKWRIEANQVPAVGSRKRDTYHEIDFSIITTDTRVPEPRNDVQSYILQNGDWSSTIGPVRPFFVRGDELVYDYQDSISFPAGKEFRFFDIRSLDVRGFRIVDIARTDEGWDAFVDLDKSRANRPYSFFADINGNFLIETNARTTGFQMQTLQGAKGDSIIHSRAVGNLYRKEDIEQCDYALVYFTFQTKQPFQDDDLYLMGKFTDWQINPMFKMKYDAENKAYIGTVFLKQGFYNYRYALVDKENGAIDWESVEGNWFETNNDYTILTYFRPFGARYDRLMAATTISIGAGRN